MYFANLVALIIAHISFVWAAIFYFKATDDGARMGKKIVTAIGGANTFVHIIAQVYYPTNSKALAILGMTIYVLSISLFWISVRTFKKQNPNFGFSDSVATEIKMTGPYRFVRHPFYLSYTLAWIAGVFCTNFWLLFSPIIMLTLYYYAARKEEKIILSSPSKDQYLEYMQKTGMFLPL